MTGDFGQSRGFFKGDNDSIGCSINKDMHASPWQGMRKPAAKAAIPVWPNLSTQQNKLKAKRRQTYYRS